MSLTVSWWLLALGVAITAPWWLRALVAGAERKALQRTDRLLAKMADPGPTHQNSAVEHEQANDR